MRAFLGIGLLGDGFTRALVKKGEKVQVWNRTASKAKALEQYGATAFDDVKDAVKGADIIHVAVKDDAAVDEVLAMAAPAFRPGVVIADHTTTTIEGAIKRTADWTSKGFFYQHAPVFMGPKNALESTGYMMVSGDQALIKRIEPQLAMMTGKVLNFGDVVGKAAAIKLTGNLFLEGLNGAVADTIAFSHAMGISTEELLGLFAQWNPGGSVTRRLEKMTGGDFSNPSWKLDTARKDAGLFMKEAAGKGIRLNVIPGVAALMDEWLAKGHAKDDWSVIGKLK